MFIRKICVISLALGLTQAAFAAEYGMPTEKLAIGESTRALLETQRSGRQAGPNLPVLGAASVLSYQRYLESHKNKIPEKFSATVGQGSGSAK